ncbi:hypothetical protein [Massilia aerilata]|uniref:ANTAR domain-containing protein n=1 Tax=Massilia aerilata TaxID=453817 RepID=A0ABW0RSX5_9BURK
MTADKWTANLIAAADQRRPGGVERRRDAVQADLVTHAIGIRNVLELHDAALFLRRSGVSDELAARVLSQHGPRRSLRRK